VTSLTYHRNVTIQENEVNPFRFILSNPYELQAHRTFWTDTHSFLNFQEQNKPQRSPRSADGRDIFVAEG
jgi:hypothetical protein